MRMLLLSIFFVAILPAVAGELDALLGEYELDSGDSDCYQTVKVAEIMDDSYGVILDEQGFLFFGADDINGPEIAYEDFKRKGFHRYRYDASISALEYFFEGKAGLFGFRYRLFLRKMGEYGLSLHINSFHYDTFLGNKVNCRYLRI